jgi:hypothetical protein
MLRGWRPQEQHTLKRKDNGHAPAPHPTMDALPLPHGVCPIVASASEEVIRWERAKAAAWPSAAASDW